MNSNCAGPVCLCNTCYFNSVDTAVVPTLSYLYRNRLFGYCRNCFDYFRHQPGILHQSTAFAVFGYFRGRTAHIDIYNCRIRGVELVRDFCHNFRVRPENLHSSRLLNFMQQSELVAFIIVIVHAFGTYHFRINKTAFLLLAEYSERHIGYSRHWS
jgi:hypothetical protein